MTRYQWWFILLVWLVPVSAQGATYQVQAADFEASKLIIVKSLTPIEILLVAGNEQPVSGTRIAVVNCGLDAVTIATNGQTMNGARANLILPAFPDTSPRIGLATFSLVTMAEIISDGMNYIAIVSRPFYEHFCVETK